MRVAPFAGTGAGGGYVIARGETPQSADDLAQIRAVEDASPHGPMPYAAFFALVTVLAAIFTHHMRRSSYGRLVRVQLASLTLIAIACIAVKAVLLMTSVSILVIPVALLALVPTIALDRVVGLATGVLAALVISLLAPFDLGVATMMLVQVSVAGLVVSERPKVRLRPVFAAGGIATLFTGLTYPLLRYLTTGHFPTGELDDLVHSAWAAAALGPAIATVLAVPLTPLYQLLVGEITDGNLIHLEDLSHPLLRQIAERSPGTWQHSLAMANMADIAANAIGANGRLVRVGAYFHDLGKSLHPKYFIENIEPGETSPHDQLPPEVSCDAIFAHVTEGILTARRAGLHERIVDFMHMHHGNGVLEYFWAKCREQGNPRDLTIEQFRYPGHPPQSRETAILAICDAVEAASRTIKKPDAAAIDSLVQRIVYGKLHLGQLDESGLSMGDLRRVADALRETIRHANHGRIEYPWQREQSLTGPRLDSLDRPARPDSVPSATPVTSDAITPMVRRTDPEALADTADVKKAAAAAVATGREGPSARRASDDEVVPGARISTPALAIVATTPIVRGGTAGSGLAAGNVDRATLPGTVAPVLRGSGSVPPVDVPASAAVPAPAAPVAPVAAGSVAVPAAASAPIPSANATVLGTGAVSPSPSPSPSPSMGSAAPVSATLLGPIDIPRVPRSIPPTDPPRMSQPPLPRIHRTDPPPANPEPDPNATTGPHARTKAATLPPAKRGRAPTVPPIPGALPTPALPTPLAPIDTPPGVAPLGTATMVGLASGVHGLAPATATTPAPATTDEDTSAPIDALAAARDSSTPIDPGRHRAQDQDADLDADHRRGGDAAAHRDAADRHAARGGVVEIPSVHSRKPPDAAEPARPRVRRAADRRAQKPDRATTAAAHDHRRARGAYRRRPRRRGRRPARRVPPAVPAGDAGHAGGGRRAAEEADRGRHRRPARARPCARRRTTTTPRAPTRTCWRRPAATSTRPTRACSCRCPRRRCRTPRSACRPTRPASRGRVGSPRASTPRSTATTRSAARRR